MLNLELIYKSLKRAAKRIPVAKELIGLLGLSDRLLSSSEEALLVKTVLMFRELLAKQTLLKSTDSFPMNRSPTLDTPSPAAEYERMIDVYETATVNIQDVIDRLRRMGYASESSVKEEGILIFEEIYSDYMGESQQ